MPEGPSIIILKEAAQIFKGEKVIAVAGNTTKINLDHLEGKVIRDFKTWGKHFLICFDQFTLRIHLLMFGSYLINEQKETQPRLSLKFKTGELNFYACSVKEIRENINDIYDWSSDVMNETWDRDKALKKLQKKKNTMVCDLLLDQDIFSGVGNIIKNEVLYRIKVHPETKAKCLPQQKVDELLAEAVNYSFEFLKWKKEYTLRQHWLAHTKTICHRCNLPIYKKYLGVTNRRTFFCTNCQVFYKC